MDFGLNETVNVLSIGLYDSMSEPVGPLFETSHKTFCGELCGFNVFRPWRLVADVAFLSG